MNVAITIVAEWLLPAGAAVAGYRIAVGVADDISDWCYGARSTGRV